MIPFLDLLDSTRALRTELDAAYNRVLSAGRYILGPEVDAFEAEYAQYCETKHCIGVGNGLDAISLTLRAMGIGPGDEVIVPSHTFIATWLAVSHAGATPVAVEPEEDFFTLDPRKLEQAFSPKTKAIIPVHLYGHPADMDAIMELASRRGIKVLEDAAQSHGARYKGRRTGGLGHAAAFSFYPVKNLGALGDGGAITTNDDVLAERLRDLRNYGGKVKYMHDVQGFNSRLDELQAAFLRAQLPFLDTWNAHRQHIATIYEQGLADTPGLRLPRVAAWAESVWHLYVVRFKERERIQQELQKKGIGTLIHYPVPPHLSGAYQAEGVAAPSYPIAESMAKEVLSLPIGPQLSEADARAVVAAIQEVCK